MRKFVIVVALIGLFGAGGVFAQEHDHDHDHAQLRSNGPAGYQANKAVTRYELAAALFQLTTHIEAAAKQPARFEREVKPGRKSALVPDPHKVHAYRDVPKNHWAKASLAGLQARGLTLVAGKNFQGEKTMTANEIAVWVDGLAGWTEGRGSHAKGIKDLVAGGYLPQTSPLLKKATSPVSAREVGALLSLVITRAHEKITTVSPESLHGKG